jgi:hypothetical protein
MVNNAKFRALREPFLFSDFGIFAQVIRHPRLYLPFLSAFQISAICLIFVFALVCGWYIENPISSSILIGNELLAFGFGSLFLGLIGLGHPGKNEEEDLAKNGLVASICQYWVAEKISSPKIQSHLPQITISDKSPVIPDVIFIQSESFFDVRRIFSGVRAEALQHFDMACQRSYVHGRLNVPSWGANTMRPEFAALTGIPSAELGIHRFNPYRRCVNKPIHALPAIFQSAGYETACIHPHSKSFFRRNKIFPLLGFQKFIDVSKFKGAKKFGPYISDAAVTDKIVEKLNTSNRPQFLYVITMENHGPLHLEKTSLEEEKRFYHQLPPAGCSDLSAYIRHLYHADEMIRSLTEFLDNRGKPYVFSFFGEHVPSMPLVYDIFDFEDAQTDYFITADRCASLENRSLNVDELPFYLIDLVNERAKCI